MKKIIIAGVIALGLFVGVSSASALTAQDVEMLVIALNLDATKAAQLRALVPAAPVFSFTRQLGVGAKGDDVVALQTKVGVSPATGYFGPITKAAVSAYQAQNGISPTGYVGPITLAKLNTAVVVTPVPTPGTVVTPGITTVGAEGFFTAKLAATPSNNSNLTAGTNVPVIGAEIEAKQSDITVQRLDLQFTVKKTNSSGTEVHPANFVNTVKLYDGSTLILEKSLSSSDFTKDSSSSSQYYVRLTGFNFLVPKSQTKTLTVKVNTATGLDSPRWMKVQMYDSTRAIRGVDGAGIDNTDGFAEYRTHTFKTGGDSTVTQTTDSANPTAKIWAVDDDNGVEEVPMMIFKLKSTVGSSVVTKIALLATSSIATSSPTSLKLYYGSELIGSESVTSSASAIGAVVNFTDLTIDLSKDQTKVFTVKADFPALARGTSTVTLDRSASEYETPDGSSGIFSGNDITSEVVTLNGKAANVIWVSSTLPTVVTDPNTGTTTRMEAIMRLNITASGGDLVEPVASDFVIKAATSTAGTQITLANVGFTVTPDNTNNLIADGSTAQVVLTPTLVNSSVAIDGSYYFYVYSTRWQIDSQSAVTQTTGLDGFKTQPIFFDK
ncbi:MAG: peptidoglycan-binding domain-containing protein [bacterium]